MVIKSRRDFWSGLMFLVTGAAFAWGATIYSFGNSARPGPGYFPFGLGILLAILGARKPSSTRPKVALRSRPAGATECTWVHARGQDRSGNRRIHQGRGRALEEGHPGQQHHGPGLTGLRLGSFD